MSGSFGSGIFVFATTADSVNVSGGFDLIQGFAARADRLDFSQIDANTSRAGDQAFAFVQFGSGAGSLRPFQQNGQTFIEAHVNGDSIADVVVAPDGAMNLTAIDVLF